MTVRRSANGGKSIKGRQPPEPQILARLLAAAARRSAIKGRLIDRFA